MIKNKLKLFIILNIFILTLNACMPAVPAETDISSDKIIDAFSEKASKAPSFGETLFEAAQRLSWGVNLCEDNQYVYYSNDAGIWAYNKNSYQEKCILEDKYISYIYLSKGKLYFSAYQKWENKKFYELAADGTKKLICSSSDFGNDVVLSGDFFEHNNIFYLQYYYGGYKIFNPANGEISEFGEDIGTSDQIENIFYSTKFRSLTYGKNNFIKKINMLTGEEEYIFSPGKAMDLDITAFKNELYFFDEYNNLCKYSKENKIEKLFKLSDAKENPIITFPAECKNENLYYFLRKEGKFGSLYMYNPTTNENRLYIETFEFDGIFTVFHDVLINYNFDSEKIEYSLL